jgi:hypothetical protein
VRTLDEAARFLDEVGFALLFPTDRLRAPSLYEEVAGPEAVPWATGMGPAEELVWTWKDELPKAGLAWYGKFLYRRASLLSPRLLAALYAGAGEPDDHTGFDLPADAHRIAEALAGGALPTAALREIVGHRGRYNTAMAALHRALLVTTAGVREMRTGWPAAVVELTCRLFDVGGTLDREYATRRFFDTLPDASPAELARAFGWPRNTGATVP